MSDPTSKKLYVATRKDVPTHEIAVLVPKSRAMPGTVVETATCSNEDKKMEKHNATVTNKIFFGRVD